MHIAFWPHVWAIPLLLMLGVALGWYLRSLLERVPFDNDGFHGPNSFSQSEMKKQDPGTRAESATHDPKAPDPR